MSRVRQELQGPQVLREFRDQPELKVRQDLRVPLEVQEQMVLPAQQVLPAQRVPRGRHLLSPDRQVR